MDAVFVRAIFTLKRLLGDECDADAADFIKNLIDESYKTGYKDAVTNYAVCKDGERLVGVRQRPLNLVLEEVDKATKIPINY